MGKKDLLIICQFFYPEYITSAQLPFQTATYLASEGYKIGVLTGYPKEYLHSDIKVPIKEDIDGISIKRIKYIQLKRGNKLSRLINYFSFTFMMLLNIFHIRKYKAVMVYSVPPILPIISVIAKKLFKTKIIFVGYDLYPEIAIKMGVFTSGNIVSKVMRLINDKLFHVVDNVVVLSSEMKEFVLKNRVIKEDKITVIPNWATEEKISLADNKKSYNISYLGNMGIAQDLDTIVNGIVKINETNAKIRFSFAGHGNQKHLIEEAIIANNLTNVTMYPFLKGDELDELMSNSDAFIVSLKKDLHGLAVPSKFYTYLKTNKPIIAIMNLDSDIAMEVNEYNLGYAIENGDIDGFIHAINRILTKKAIDYSEIEKTVYSREVQLKKYSNLFERVLKGENNV